MDNNKYIKLEALLPKNKVIMFGILNWGLGHASRSIPVINAAIANGNKVVIASDGVALHLLQKEFPGHIFESLRGYNVTYKFKSLFLNMLYYSISILRAFLSERSKCKTLIAKYGVDIIVSDNRFGFASYNVTSCYITHQVKIHHTNKWLGNIATNMHHMVMRSFDQIWVPDYSDNSLAGALSATNKVHLNQKINYLGPLSRLVKPESNSPIQLKSILFLVSGPEPSRTQFENSILQIVPELTSYDITLIRGISKPMLSTPSGIKIINIATAHEIQSFLNKTSIVVARAGYSTIMDLVITGHKAILIPTPGQTEQEYLGEHHKGNKQFTILNDSDIKSKLIPCLLTALQ